MSDIKMSLDDLIEEFNRRNDLKNNNDDYIVSDDTQVGIEFAFDSIGSMQECKQKIGEKEINSHDALVEQNKVLIEALEHIKRHQETVVVGMPQLSATWQIAARALEQDK